MLLVPKHFSLKIPDCFFSELAYLLILIKSLQTSFKREDELFSSELQNTKCFLISISLSARSYKNSKILTNRILCLGYNIFFPLYLSLVRKDRVNAKGSLNLLRFESPQTNGAAGHH